MHGGPGYGGLRREIAQLLGKCRGRWDTSSTTPPGLPAARGSATTTCWAQAVSTSSPRGAHLAVRVLVAPGSVRGLAPVNEKLALTHGPIPVYLFEVGAALVPGDPKHRAVLRGAMGRGRRPAGGAGAGWDRLVPNLPAPSRGGRRVPLPRKDPRLLLEHRRPGRAGLSHLRGRRESWTPLVRS